MAALAKQRRLPGNLVSGLILTFDYPAKSGVTLYKGGLVALDAGGFLVPGAATAGLRVAGVIDLGQNEKVTTAGSDGDNSYKVQAGIWPFLNSAAGDAIAQADALKPCYLVDDQTVAKTDGGVGRAVAGTVVKIDTAVIWVAVGFPFGAAAASTLVGGAGSAAASNVVTAGALGLTTDFTRISVTGTQAYTLADGTFVGQKKYCRCTVAGSTPNGTLTPAHASGFTTIAAIDAIGDFFGLEWNGTAWEVMFATGVTVS